MNASKLLTNLLVWAGLWFASLIWAANMQLGQILPYADCRSHFQFSAIASFTGAALAALSGVASWLARQRIAGDGPRHGNVDFGSGVSALSAAIFTFALLMQGVASVVLTGCEK